MTIKSDKWIISKFGEALISPWRSSLVNKNNNNENLVSYGISSYGYDVRCGNEFKIFTNINSAIVDPKAFTEDSFVTVNTDDYCIIPPNSFALTCTLEYVRMPRNVTALCMPKSTYARCGLLCSPTVIEAGWEGQITIEISNTTPLPAKVYANEGIAQLLFFESDEDCHESYADRNGKYQGQSGVTLPKV